MSRLTRGTVNLLSFAGLLPTLVMAVGGRAALEYAALKDGPTDTRTLYALSICFVAGCVAQLSYLLAHIGDDVPRPVGRWIGEILFGGFAAYIACVAFLKYGPVVDLPQLIVPAVVGGFLGQRLLFALVEWATKRFNLPSIKWVPQAPPPPPDPPPLPPPVPPLPPGGDNRDS